jgi:hypothetical protein
MVRYVGKLTGRKLVIPCKHCKGSGKALIDELECETVEDTVPTAL